MSKTIEVKVPDIGDFKDVEVIEVLVKPGDAIAAEQSLVTLESDKATMEIPSPGDGVVKELKVKVGDKVSQGSLILMLEEQQAAAAPQADPKPEPKREAKPEPKAEAAAGARTVKVPDIGDFKEVEVIELLVKPGDTVTAEQSLITLESDKATMEIPSPSAGVVKELKVKVGDKISQGAPILMLEESSSPSEESRPEKKEEGREKAQDRPAATAPETVTVPDIGDFKETRGPTSRSLPTT